MSEPIQSISQGNYILATQQEVSHDNTLSGNGTSASPLGLNETVLWSGAPSTSINVSEPFSNFESIKITAYAQEQNSGRAQTFEFLGTNSSIDLHIYNYNAEGTSIVNYLTRYNINGSNFSASVIHHWWQLTGSVTGGIWSGPGANPVVPIKIIGINRK